ncbi:aldehyde dehydrogenase family protein [Rhodococcus koreensis]
MSTTFDGLIEEQQQLTVGGSEFTATTFFDVVNPATGQAFAAAPSLAVEDLDKVFAVAQSAYLKWQLDDDHRRSVLREMARALEESVDQLAPILTAEQGKPLKNARREIEAASTWLRYYAELEVGPIVVRDDDVRFEAVTRKPLGVVAAITPWNAPITLAFWKIAPALRAGNTLVVKPSPYTPLTTLAVGRLFRGIVPDGVLNVIAGPEPLGGAMVAHPVPRKVSFTGSTTIGRRVAVAAAERFKRVTLELGGNDPAIILEDSDVADIAPKLFWSAFANNGQICAAVKRVYVPKRLKNPMTEALAELARSVRVDDGFVPDVELGPLNNATQRDIVSELVEDARRSGGRIAAGGASLERDGYFYSPTIVENVGMSTRIVREEQFGPALPVIEYGHLDDAIADANDTEYALTASVWTKDLGRASEVAARLEAGQISINSHASGAVPYLPFGGHKSSGVGVENGPWGYESFTELQAISAPAGTTL